MPDGNTYSFIDVVATIAGPGGAISLGNGAGPSKEGISFEMKEDKNKQDVGADGQIMNSLRASKAGKITIRLLKTSPANALLSALYNFQQTASNLWGQNTLLVSDVARGDVATGSSIAFVRQTGVTWGEDANMNEWAFEGAVDLLLGAGQPNVNV